MEVILIEKISGLGDIGAIVKVKDGFARNYLIPRKKVLRATVANKLAVAERKAALEQQHAERKAQAQDHASVIANSILSVIRQAGEDGKLYGSVSAKDVAKSLSEKFKVHIVDEMVVIFNKIKGIGIHTVKVVLHPDISFDVLLNVARSEQEATAAIEAYNKTLPAQKTEEEGKPEREVEAKQSQVSA